MLLQHLQQSCDVLFFVPRSDDNAYRRGRRVVTPERYFPQTQAHPDQERRVKDENACDDPKDKDHYLPESIPAGERKFIMGTGEK